MCAKNILTKTDFSHNGYLSNLDLINKYNFKNKKAIPFLKDVIISFHLKAFLPFFYNKNKTESDPELQIKCLSLIYTLFCQTPYINYEKQLKTQKFLTVYENHYALKITLSKRELIPELLAKLFFEQVEEIPKYYLKSKKTTQTIEYTFGTFVRLNNFSELKTFFNTVNIGFEAKEFFFNFKFNFIDSSQKDTISIIKNVAPFWVFKN